MAFWEEVFWVIPRLSCPPANLVLLIPEPTPLRGLGKLGENVWPRLSSPSPHEAPHPVPPPTRDPGIGSFLPSPWGKRGWHAGGRAPCPHPVTARTSLPSLFPSTPLRPMTLTPYLRPWSSPLLCPALLSLQTLSEVRTPNLVPTGTPGSSVTPQHCVEDVVLVSYRLGLAEGWLCGALRVTGCVEDIVMS